MQYSLLAGAGCPAVHAVDCTLGLHAYYSCERMHVTARYNYSVVLQRQCLQHCVAWLQHSSPAIGNAVPVCYETCRGQAST